MTIATIFSVVALAIAICARVNARKNMVHIGKLIDIQQTGLLAAENMNNAVVYMGKRLDSLEQDAQLFTVEEESNGD